MKWDLLTQADDDDDNNMYRYIELTFAYINTKLESDMQLCIFQYCRYQRWGNKKEKTWDSFLQVFRRTKALDDLLH